jgi:threonine synthase
MLIGTPYWNRVLASGFVSGSSTHSDRLATIRSLHQSSGSIVDPHTADGIKVAREHLVAGVPMICLETALPVKFAETIVAAIGREPERPAAYVGIERRPQRCEVMPADAERIKSFIAQHAG